MTVAQRSHYFKIVTDTQPPSVRLTLNIDPPGPTATVYLPRHAAWTDLPLATVTAAFTEHTRCGDLEVTPDGPGWLVQVAGHSTRLTAAELDAAIAFLSGHTTTP
jgi:hypothetical protein